MDRTAVARLVRRRELVEVLRGVYVDHTGPTSWQQRAWAAVLWAWPAALAGQSAWRAFEGPGRRSREVERLHVVVERHRRLTAPPGIVLHRRSGFADRVLWNLGPPRVRMEEAVLDVALAAPDELGTIAALADAAGGRRTTSARLRAALDGRPWVPRRALIGAVLDDVEAGSCSAAGSASAASAGWDASSAGWSASSPAGASSPDWSSSASPRVPLPRSSPPGDPRSSMGPRPTPRSPRPG